MAKKSTRKKATRKKARRKKTTRKKKAVSGRARSAATKKTRRSGGRGSLRKVSTSALEAELARRESMIDEIQSERDEVATRLAELDARLATYGIRRGQGGRSGGGGKRPRNDMNLADSLAAVLKGQKLSVTQLAEAVQSAGYKTTSPNFRTIVNQTLIKDPKRFKKVSRGIYTV